MATSFDKQVGALVKARRKKAGKTLKEAGEKLGISEGQMSKKEAGLHSIDTNDLSILAALYGCQFADLIPKAKKGKG